MLALILLALAAPCTPAAPQTYKTYVRLLEGYRNSDETPTRELEAFWTRLEEQIPVATGPLFCSVPIELTPLSQMALTDFALAAFTHGDRMAAERHLLLVERWIDARWVPVFNSVAFERERQFARDWYRTIAWTRFARGEIASAMALLQRGREKFPDDPELALSSGTAAELVLAAMRLQGGQAKLFAAPGPSSIRSGPRSAFDSDFRISLDPVEPNVLESRAVNSFHDAIRLDPNGGAEARIRLAYFLHSSRSPKLDEERQLLNDAHAIAKKPPLSYLSALFAGLVAEALKHPDNAATWYRTAIADCPLAQTARLALSHLQLSQNLLSAQNSLRPLMIDQRPPVDNVCEPDPWRNYAFGQAWRLPDQLVAIRKQAREPVEGSQP